MARSRRVAQLANRFREVALAAARRTVVRGSIPRLLELGATTPFRDGSWVYLPWMPTHGDALLRQVADGHDLVPLTFFRHPERLRQRRKINRLVCDHPDLYREHVRALLAPLVGRVRGLIFTHDWPPAMRQVVFECRALGVPTVLVPHEAVFTDRELYYRDRITGADVPVCDRVLCWGELQRDLFVERGYPRDRTTIVGSPKLDAALAYTPTLSRDAFCALYGFESERPFVLLVLQPLDSQRDTEGAREAQLRAVEDALAACARRALQLLVRLPPSGHAILPPALIARLLQTRGVALDGALTHRASAAESLAHCALVCSLNSTMLLEGALMGRHAVALRYMEFDELFAHAGIPRACDAEELDAQMAIATRGAPGLPAEGLHWAARAFSAGVFDGGSLTRIRAELVDGRAEALDPCAHLFRDTALGAGSGTAALHRVPTPAMAHVEAMLGFRRYLHAPRLPAAQVADVFVKWGASVTPAKRAQDALVRALGRPQLVVEDGFLRSRRLGVSGAPGLSIVVDTCTAYYDATRPSRLEQRLNSAHTLSDAQRTRAARCVAEIKRARLSKYNHAPDTRQQFCRGAGVLLVDQRRGDASVVGALADEAAFARMLRWALAERAGRPILVKRHPDAIGGGKSSYFGPGLPELDDARVTLIDHDVNPHTLFDQVDEVCVVSSGMGFEALLAGLQVRCFGVPFYAGWGLTADMASAPRRRRERGVLEVFHYAYIEASRYFSESARRRAEIEDVIDDLANSANGRAPDAR